MQDAVRGVGKLLGGVENVLELLRYAAPVLQDAVGGVGKPLGGVENFLELLQDAADCWTVPGGGGRVWYSLAGGEEKMDRTRRRPPCRDTALPVVVKLDRTRRRPPRRGTVVSAREASPRSAGAAGLRGRCRGAAGRG